MANSKVSDLTETTTITDADEFWINDGGTSKRITKANLEGDLAIAASQLSDVTSTAAELNILDGVTSTTAELNILDGVTSTASELNLLDGVTSTTAELNILDGVTSSAAEINQLDGLASSKADPGHQELPGGMLDQWFTFESTQDSDETITLPTANNTATVCVTLTPIDTHSGSGIGMPFGVPSKTATNFVVSRDDDIDGSYTIQARVIGY